MKRIFSGIQPSGRLHLGNYLGAIKNWLPLQEEYECIWGIVDYHAITVPFAPENLEKRVIDCAATYLACGLDPKKSHLMIQSQVKEHTELAWILNTITPISWLERVPTFKDKSRHFKDSINMGLLDYPVLMAADVLLYKASAVPVGEDQLPHLELAREIVRRFNHIFGDTFPEPKEIIRPGSLIKGLDGNNKMSKSLDNCIYLDESADSIRKKLATAVTDPQRVRKSDPGNPDVCNLYSLHKLFSSSEEIEYVNKGCRKAEIGCVECKRILAKNINEELQPIRERINELKSDTDYIKDVLRAGVKISREIAKDTIDEVYTRIGTGYNLLK
ncbi:MAG: tryptophan--tRNA ligase [Candidatus Cloacimonadota bacterium]|nr:tryptophan--tRNA ligase [Candidatus Cloacimonadota bacterium]